MSKELAEIEIQFHGPAATHNMPCPIYYDKHAVFNCHTGTFSPCWYAQNEGYFILQVRNKYIRKLIQWIFK